MNLIKMIDYEKSKRFFDYSSENKLQGFAFDNSFFFNDIELGIDYFLGDSELDCYNFKRYNEEYNSKKDYVAIGVLLGGDTFGYYKNGNEIYINLDTQSNVDDEVFACVAKNLNDFLAMVFKN